MSDNLIEHEAIRARVEKRLEPSLRLLRRRAWLFAHIVIFVIVMALVHTGNHASSLFYYSVTQVIPEAQYPGPDGAMFTVPEQTYTSMYPHALTSLVSWLWLVLVIVHCVMIWSAFARERTIQREMEREMELEKMRIQLELTRMNRAGAADDGLEKPKRVARLSDDGELAYEEKPVQRSKNHRRS